MTKTKHTPALRPEVVEAWVASILMAAEDIRGGDFPDADTLKEVAISISRYQNLILRAVNCHDELVEAAKLALGLLDPGPPMIIDHADCECFRVRRSVTDKLKAALTKATA